MPLNVPSYLNTSNNPVVKVAQTLASYVNQISFVLKALYYRLMDIVGNRLHTDCKHLVCKQSYVIDEFVVK